MPDDAPRASVRPATSDESLAVRRVLDGALLEVRALEERIESGEVLVAVDDGRTCGAIVVAPDGPGRPHGSDAPTGSFDGARDASGSESSGESNSESCGESCGESSSRSSRDSSSAPTDASPEVEPELVPDRCRDAAHVRAVAVRRRRRGNGIGSALVRDAATRFGTLAADFEEDLRPFYAPLAEAVIDGPDGRLWARIEEPD